ncbi:MAG: peroxiredoxin [Pseudomonadota bacterium]|nr:peroxiredoxin [Pseudomonadota bacterium]
MKIKPGDIMPDGIFSVMKNDQPASLTAKQLFSNKKVVLFAVPGAFTPGCSNNHLPSYLENAKAIFSKGIDTIACLSVNDIFVMSAWAKDKVTGDNILMLADGNCDYTKSIGLEMDSSDFGMGMRSRRYALIIENTTVKELLLDKPGEINLSMAQSVLAKL